MSKKTVASPLKKRILLIWFEMSKRPELLEPFEKMADDFEFIHLYFNTPEQRIRQEVSKFPVIFWFDFATPYQLLNKVKPDLIFSEFPMSLQLISVRVAAKNRGIPYISMTHAIYFEDSYEISIPNGNSLANVKRYGHYRKVLFFYLSSIRAKNGKDVFNLLKLLYLQIRHGWFHAINNLKFPLRHPDKYIVYQLQNTHHCVVERHGFPAEKLLPIGSPIFDPLFEKFNRAKEDAAFPTGNYYLMIDVAWMFFADMPSAEALNAVYTKLGEFCASKGCKLVVKLHPYWYEKADLPQSEHVEYVCNLSQNELSDLILQARGCFLYFSSLSIPIVPYKKCYFLYHGKVLKDLRNILSMKVAKSLNVEDFEASDIDFENGFGGGDIDRFIEEYLYAVDGKATERLRKEIKKALV